MARIITIVRTRNEEKRIELFCRQHDFSDLILVADGGSDDDTVKLAKTFKNVIVRKFEKEIELLSGYTRNPDWEHINFLIEWANEEKAEWIVMNDCDTNPNYLLKEDARKSMEESTCPYIRAVQIFLWRDSQYFPSLSRSRGNGAWWPGIWAWKSETQMRVFGEPPHFQFTLGNKKAADFNAKDCLDLLPPYCQIHANWINEEETNKHVEMYRSSGLIRGMRHPTDFGGAPVKRDEWMRYEN